MAQTERNEGSGGRLRFGQESSPPVDSGTSRGLGRQEPRNFTDEPEDGGLWEVEARWVDESEHVIHHVVRHSPESFAPQDSSKRLATSADLENMMDSLDRIQESAKGMKTDLRSNTVTLEEHSERIDNISIAVNELQEYSMESYAREQDQDVGVNVAYTTVGLFIGVMAVATSLLPTSVISGGYQIFAIFALLLVAVGLAGSGILGIYKSRSRNTI